MAFKKVCPKCAEFVSRKDTVCPFCGEILDENAKYLNSLVNSEDDKIENSDVNYNSDEDENIANLSEDLDNKNKSDEIDEQAVENSDKDLNENKNSDNLDNDNLVKPAKKRHAHKKKKQETPMVEIGENGEYSINTSDVTFFEGAKETYSEKKARGEGTENKIQWWEIYKWADLYLARRKINKEVNKAAVIEPPYISHSVLLLLCLFFGTFGGHNYYAKNTRKGIFVNICLLISIIAISVPQFEGVIDVSIGGGFGFIVFAMWIWDLISIIFYKYKFRESKLKFICKLNLETRKKLGKKYININEWFVPFEKKQKKSKKMRQTKI